MFWIVLGKPHEIQRFDGLNEVVATEVWFYNGDPKLGQPPRFNLVFFKQQDIGEYELYSPMGDGPKPCCVRARAPGTARIRTWRSTLWRSSRWIWRGRA